ncbi:MAG: phenylacetate-CoA oxygenase subunit PaaC [Chitinophagaceae bacterium]|nr:phenylacetate-CoA oxygenase subunit PaaC [Chitinophagaceae bacterium]
MTPNQPINISTNQLFNYTLHLADNNLILGHRNSEWTGHGPVLEQDIALSNIALDLVGQARNFYQYAAQLKNDGSTEDTFAYLRDANEFKNVLLVEQSNGDWGKTILRQFLFSVYQYYLYQQLEKCSDRTIASITEKALKEITYHIRWSSEWVIRLGDGTIESHARMNNALHELSEFTDELFIPASYEIEIARQGIMVDPVFINARWREKVEAILREATLPFLSEDNNKQSLSGKEGQHTENLIHILSEMQSLQRAYPGCEW